MNKPKNTKRTVNAVLSDGSEVKNCVACYLIWKENIKNKKTDLPYVVRWEYAD